MNEVKVSKKVEVFTRQLDDLFRHWAGAPRVRHAEATCDGNRLAARALWRTAIKHDYGDRGGLKEGR